jgi:virulence factor Mce-like protein
MKSRFASRLTAQSAPGDRSRLFLILLGTLGIVIGVVMVYVGFKAPDAIPGRSYFNVNAQFNDADNLSKHSQVRVGGKIVGQVLDPRVKDGKAIVKLQMDPSVKPLLSDTKVIVRPRSAVGVRYVDVVPGRSGQPLGDGDMIPSSQTSATRQLDEVLSTFDPETRVNTQKFLRNLGQGTAGRGEDLNAAIGAAPRFLTGTEAVTKALADRPGAVSGLIRGGAGAADAADPVRDAIATGFEPEAQALGPFHEEATGFRETLDRAPAALRTVQQSLAQTDPFVRDLGSLARNVRPALTSAPAALHQTRALFREARPGLRAADGTLRTLGRGVSPTLQLLAAVRPVLPDVDATLTDALPITDTLGQHGCDITMFGRNWTSMMANGNAGGGYLRLELVTPAIQSIAGLQDLPLGLSKLGNYKNPYPKPCVAGTEKPGQ